MAGTAASRCQGCIVAADPEHRDAPGDGPADNIDRAAVNNADTRHTDRARVGQPEVAGRQFRVGGRWSLACSPAELASDTTVGSAWPLF